MLTKTNIENIKRYCREDITLIENFTNALNDTSKTRYICHHRLEIQPDGQRLSVDQLIEKCLYYHRPASELIILSLAEHNKLHFTGKKQSKEHITKRAEKHKGLTHSDAAKHKMSIARKGVSPWNKNTTGLIVAWNKGKTGIFKHSDETKQKISEANIGKHSTLKGTHISDEHKNKISESMKGKNNGNENGMFGKHWYTNGETNICAYKCPEGFHKGRVCLK